MDSEISAKPEKVQMDGVFLYITLLWKRRLVIVLVTGIVTLATIAFCAISVVLPADQSPLPNTYKAEATILVQSSGQPDISNTILTGLGYNAGTESNNVDNGQLIIEVLKSRWVLDSLAKEFDLSERFGIRDNVKGNSRSAILGKSTFDYSYYTGSLKIGFSDTDPVFAKNIVNKMVSLLESWFNQNRGIAKQKQKQELEEKIKEVTSTIETLQNRLKGLQKRYGVLNVQELGQSQASAVASLRAQLILKDVEIKNYTSFSKIDDPRLEQLKEERKNLVDLIDQTQKSLPDSQQGAGGTQSRALASLPDVAQEFTQLTLELDIQQKIYNTLSPQYEAAKLAPESEPIFQILELADVPDIKSGPKRSQIVLIAFAVSLIGSMAVIIGLNLGGKVFRKFRRMIELMNQA
jgi:tyrosine-protein kinase Etk/Wzc